MTQNIFSGHLNTVCAQLQSYGLSIKGICSKGGRGGGERSVQCRHFANKGGSSDANSKYFGVKKLQIFKNL